MKFINSILIAFAMYSRIPVPNADWKEENMRYVMAAFPLVGVVIGAIYGGIYYLTRYLPVSVVLRAVILTVLPILLTGGIHMDGLMDTADGFFSYKSKEERLEILKDSHAGAFAILACGVYLLCSFGVTYEMILRLDARSGEELLDSLILIGVIFALSRALSAVAVVSFPMAKNTGLAAGFKDAAAKRNVRLIGIVLIGFFAGIGFSLRMKTMAVVYVFSLLTYEEYYRLSKKTFGGITGDVAGAFLQMAELLMFAGYLFF